MYGISTYIWLICMVNVGKYTSPMDPVSKVGEQRSRDAPRLMIYVGRLAG